MSTRMQDLLQAPRIRAMTQVAAGSRRVAVRAVCGEEGYVEDVSRRLSEPVRRVMQGTVLVLLTPVARFDARFDVLMRRAALTGVTAIALTAASSLTQFGAGLDELAGRLGLALLVVSEPWEFSVQVRMLIGEGDLVAARAALDVAEVGLSAGPSLEETFAELDGVIGHRIEFLDGTGLPLRGSLELNEKQRRLLSEKTGNDDVTEIEIDRGVLLAMAVGTGFSSRALIGVIHEGRLRAERVAVAAALRVASVVVGHRLTLLRLVDERDARYRTTMLEELRATAPTPPPSLIQRTITAGWRLDEWHIGVRIVARNADDFVALRPAVESVFATQRLIVEVVEQIDGWALWTSHADEPSPAAVRDLAMRMRNAQVMLSPTVDTNVGVGSVQAGALGLVHTLAEAGDASRVAGGRVEAEHFVHVDQLGLAQLLLAWTQTDTFRPAAHQLLEPLAQSSSDLLKTLRIYLDAESSLAAASATLGVHRNTIADRIARVERLLGVRLNDPESRLALHLAVRTITD